MQLNKPKNNTIKCKLIIIKFSSISSIKVKFLYITIIIKNYKTYTKNYINYLSYFIITKSLLSIKNVPPYSFKLGTIDTIAPITGHPKV